MIKRLYERLLLSPGDVPASRSDFEVIGVFNPGAARVGGEVVLLVRVAERPSETRTGVTGLPRWDCDLGLTVDWVADERLEFLDPRVVRLRDDGTLRLTFISHLRVVRCGDGRSVREVTGVCLRPESEIEEYGVEDPRITPIDGRCWITYVTASRHGASTSLASTDDFAAFERRGVIFCTENKDVLLFPERVAGAYVALHRPNGAMAFTKPEIWLARSPDLLHWGRHEPLHAGRAAWETGKVGGGTPPVRVEGGWLTLYHGNRAPSRPGDVGAYAAGTLLLDINDPSRVLRRSTSPCFAPEAVFERNGFVPDVVFPTGIVADGDRLLVYYGAADSHTAVVEFALDDVLATLHTGRSR